MVVMEHRTKYESIVLMGKITAGKGTQADRLADRYGSVLFSVGQLVRDTAAADSAFGRRMKVVYESGELIPEWIASYWMTEALISRYPETPVIFEAVARKPDEAELFHTIHEWIGRSYVVLNLEVSDEEVLARSAARNRDVVDAEHVVRRRLAEFAAHTKYSIDIFRSYGKVIDIDGTCSKDEVFEEILKNIE